MYYIYEPLEQTVVTLFSKNLLTKEILDVILEPHHDCQMNTGNSDPIILESGMRFDYILMYFYNNELFNELLKQNEGKIDEKFEELFCDNNWFWDFQRKKLLWW